MNKLLTIGTGVALLGLSSCACAAMITINDGGTYNGTEVGGADLFIESADKVGNPTAETEWVNDTLLAINAAQVFPLPDEDVTVTYTVKTENVDYYSTDAEDTFAFSLMNSDPRPDYFLIKNSDTMVLFENLSYVGWGVFDLNDIILADGSKLNLGNELDEGETWQISHVTEFINGESTRHICNPALDPTCATTVVPIPPAVWLFGAGLLGLVGVARRNPA